MKIIAYEVKEFEKASFEEAAKRTGAEITYVETNLNSETIAMAEGYEGISTLGRSIINKDSLDQLKKMGILFISTRTIGYNHIDVNYAKEIGIKVANSNYDPHCVADYTVMFMLMSLRHYKQALWRNHVNDYALNGLQGKEMRNLTIGIVGTGRIGAQVIQNLTGFGCKIIAFDPFPNSFVSKRAEYVDLDTLYKESDIVSLHVPLMDATEKMINKTSIDKMKEGVVLINCSRGELMDIDDIIDGIENEKIGALALDVFEDEEEIYHKDRRIDIIKNKNMAYLRQFRNVLMTPHIAFFTDAASESMVNYSIDGLVNMKNTGTCATEIK